MSRNDLHAYIAITQAAKERDKYGRSFAHLYEENTRFGRKIHVTSFIFKNICAFCSCVGEEIFFFEFCVRIASTRLYMNMNGMRRPQQKVLTKRVALIEMAYI